MVVYLIDRDAFSEGFADGEWTFICVAVNKFQKLLNGIVFEVFELKMAGFDFKGSDGFEHRFLDGAANAHDLTGGFHLGG